MKTAIREDDPIIFCEDRTVLGSRAHVPEEEYLLPFGVADIKREGTNVTVVAIGGMVPRALQAAEKLAEEGVSVEVVDPCTLVPLDERTVLGIGGQDGAAGNGGYGPQDLQRGE